jgi:hypothetical protein
MASTSAAAVADELPCSTMRAPSSMAARSAESAVLVLALAVVAVELQQALAPPGSLTPPRALTRSTAHSRLRNTASPVLANGPLMLSIRARRMGAGGLGLRHCGQRQPLAHSAERREFQGPTAPNKAGDSFVLKRVRACA